MSTSIDLSSAGQPSGDHRQFVVGAALSAFAVLDSTLVITCSDDKVQVWDVTTGQPTGSPLTGPTDVVLSMAVTPDHAHVVTGSSDGTVRAWDLATRQAIGRPLTEHTDSVLSVAVTSDNTRVVTGSRDRTVRVWDLRTGEPNGNALRGHTDTVMSVAVTPDNTRIVSGSLDGTVRVWDLATREAVGRPLTGHTDGVLSVAVTPDNTRIVTGSSDNTVRVWDLATGQPIGSPLTGHADGVLSVAVTSDSTRVVAGSFDRTVRIWDLATGQPIGPPLTGHTGSVEFVAVTPDDTRIVTGSHDGAIRTWDLPELVAGRPLDGSTDVVESVAVTPDSTRVVTGGGDNTVRVWDLATGQPIGAPFTGHTGAVWSVAVTPDNARVITGGADQTVRVWDLASHEQVGQPLTGHTGGVGAVAVTPDNTRVVTGGSDNMVRVWDLATGQPIGAPLTGHTGAVWSVAVTPDSARAVTGGADKTVRIWDLASLEQVGQPLTGHTGDVNSVAVTPDNTRIVTGGDDGTVRIWSLATGQPIGRPLVGHTGDVYSVAVTPDNTRVITGGTDKTVRIWDLTSHEQVGLPLTGHTGSVWWVVVTPDGSHVITASDDRTVRVWRPFEPGRVEWYPGLVTDAESATDRLGMTADVQTMAALLAATSTTPPLSVALMGNWGSGKSTFMKLVIDEVDKLAGTYRPDPVYARQVRQVRFNAWHYSDDHLWVGLVEHLFRELRRTPAPQAAPDAAAARLANVRAELATEKASQAHLSNALNEVDELDPDRGGWIAWLGQIRRAFVVARHAGADLWRQLRWRAVAVSIGFAVLVVAGVIGAVRYGDLLSGWLQSLGWVTAAVAAVSAVITPLRVIWKKAQTVTTTARAQLLLSQQRHADRIRALEETLTDLDPARRLDQLLTEISDTDRYANYRGLTGRIHHDLQRLNEQLAAAHKDDPARQWRIILYIDDLDRCVAGRVVEVLQAVNLLLSMELFLVVVAVDPRWLLRAIDEHHGALLYAKPGNHTGDGDHAGYDRPLDYLDKIFHVAYAVRPAGEHAADYLRGLLPKPTPPATALSPRPHGERHLVAQPAPVDDRTAADSETGAGDTAPSRAATSRPDTSTPAVTAVQRLPGPVSVANLEISQAEADFLPLLADLLPTPRAMKKLANLYRLIRITIPADQLSTFVGDHNGGPYQAAALLLACLVGDPGNARHLLERVATTPPSGDIVTALEPRQDEPRRSDLPARLAGHIERLRTTTAVHTDPATYRDWAVVVARYSFETYEMFTASAGHGTVSGR